MTKKNSIYSSYNTVFKVKKLNAGYYNEKKFFFFCITFQLNDIQLFKMRLNIIRAVTIFL